MVYTFTSLIRKVDVTVQRSELWGLCFKPNTIPPSLVPFWSRKWLGDSLTDACYLTVREIESSTSAVHHHRQQQLTPQGYSFYELAQNHSNLEHAVRCSNNFDKLYTK